MKRFLVFFLITFAITALSAQTPFYILFNKSCMDQLEYKYTYYGNAMQGYSLRPTASEQFLLNAANEGIVSPGLPKGTVSCRDMKLLPDFIDAINGRTRNVYIVHQRAQGDYLLMPIISATYVSKNGAFYMVRGANYAFALDTTRLVNETNLATGNSPSYVYFTGMKFRDCTMEYSFRREPIKANMERSDFEFISGIGLTSERTGVSASDAEANHLRLIKVNGLPLDDHIALQCTGKSPQVGSTISPWTPPVDYGNPPANTAVYGPSPYKEPTKEEASAQLQQTYAPNPATGLVNCPEPLGAGYHIVQPRENLRAIARTYGVKEANLIAWNNIKNPNQIEICQKIWLKKPPANAAVSSKGAAPAKTAQSSEPGKWVVDQSAYWNNQQQQKGVAQYSNTQPQAYNSPANATSPPQTYSPPVQYSTTVMPATQPMQQQMHKVKTGDYLYKLAKQYGCAEECIRRANNMPLEGDVPLWPGQQLIIPDCTCTMPTQKGVTQTPAQNPYTAPTQYQYNNSAPAQNQQYTAPAQYSNPNLVGPKPQQANANTFVEKPVATNPYQSDARPDYMPQTGQQVAPQTYNTQPATQPASTTEERTDTYFTEHVVQQGETLNAIAIKYKVNGAELAQVNGVNANETLMPGKRLLIPHKR